MSAEATDTLRAVLVGCGGMGRNQAKILAGMDEFELVGVCDVLAENAERAAELAGTVAYTDFGEMLAATSPDTVSVCTANDTHAALTIQAAEAGVRGVYCEKPMATNLADARAMTAACEEAGIPLVINHQRRLRPDLVEARMLIEAGAVGEVRVLRGQCAGDVLSDGTHLVDSLLWLLGDPQIEWVFGQIERDIEADRARLARRGRGGEPGCRYGHPVETGASAVVKVADGPRIELLTGDVREPDRIYQDYEVLGTAGRLWRTGDRHKPNLFIQDADGGSWRAGTDEWMHKPVPAGEGEAGTWRPVELPEFAGRDAMVDAYGRFAAGVRGGGDPHPMRAANALRGFEVVMAVYESARLHRKLSLPLRQDRFPLELMIEAGTFE